MRVISNAEDQQFQLYTVLDLLIRAKKYEQFAEAIDQISSAYSELQPQQLHTLISALISAGESSLAIQLVQTIQTPELKAQAMEMIAAGLAQRGEFDQALEISRTIESPAFRSAALADTAEALARAGRNEEAQTLFETAVQQAKSLEESEEQVSVLTYIARTLANAELLDNALETLAQIPRIDFIDDRYEKIRINGMIAVSNQLYEASEIEKANQVIQQAIDSTFELNDFFNRSFIFNDIATQLVTQGQIDRAIELNRTTEERNLSIRRAIAVALVHQNQIALALEISRDSSDPDTLRISIFETVYPQSPSRAFDIAQMIQDRGSRASMLSRLAYYWTIQKEYERVINIAEQIRIADPNVYLLEGIALDLAKVGQYPFAVQVTGMISNPQQSVRACQNVLLQTVKNLLEANQIDRALQITSRITIPEQSSEAISSIARHLFVNGDREQALSLVNTIQNESIRLRTYGNFAYTLAHIGEYDQALQFAQKILTSAEQLNSLQGITRVLIDNQQYDRALDLIEQYSSKRRQAEDLSVIAVALIQAGETEPGFALLNRALAIVNLPPLSAQLSPTSS
ncbi:hypothetical protein [Leptolyngbya ohadii]|uniref:hypothetical protein n=1 Tax=Leptolyngbya ohadii TaxID=1962290 RepID=UPI0015C5C878|nr:hypothetical protein [Leptolyngbya ohadii]